MSTSWLDLLDAHCNVATAVAAKNPDPPSLAEPQLICSGYSASTGPCRAIINPSLTYFQHRVTGSVLCVKCRKKIDFHHPQDWVQK